MEKVKDKIRLLLIEDNRILREGIISVLKPILDISIIAESEDSESTIREIHKLKPNVIVIDLGLRSRNSFGIVEIVRKEFPQSKIIVMDLVPVQADIFRFAKEGASGFVLKDATLYDFLSTIRAVAEEVKVLPVNINDSLFTRIIENAIKSGKTRLINVVKMSKREKEILALIGDGFTKIMIAQKLKISEYIVKNIISNILKCLALRIRLEPSNYYPGLSTVDSFSGGIAVKEL